MTTEPQPVERLADAKVGDHVWLYDSQQANYVDGEYQGRGVWRIVEITGENRTSFIVWRGTKFDRRTGEERDTRGFTPSYHIYGAVERENHIWRGRNRAKIAQLVERLDDVAKLKAIAEIVGFEP